MTKKNIVHCTPTLKHLGMLQLSELSPQERESIAGGLRAHECVLVFIGMVAGALITDAAYQSYKTYKAKLSAVETNMQPNMQVDALQIAREAVKTRSRLVGLMGGIICGAITAKIVATSK